ncbi:MAG: DKNYY domain-containing protein [Isosphaeraceae bacterium]
MNNLDTPLWSTDGGKVLHLGRPVRGADPKTFEPLLGTWARDARHVYQGPFRCPKIDRNTFRPLNAIFGIDAAHAYCGGSPICDAEAGSFRTLDAGLQHNEARGAAGTFLPLGYAADARNVWCCGTDGFFRLKDADAGSFVSFCNGFGKDKQRIYHEHARINGADLVTWRPWRGLHSIDQTHVFWTSKKVKLVDRRSLVLLGHRDCFMDRNRLYCADYPISVKEYLGHLARDEDSLMQERIRVETGVVFDRLLSEWPQVV